MKKKIEDISNNLPYATLLWFFSKNNIRPYINGDIAEPRPVDMENNAMNFPGFPPGTI